MQIIDELGEILDRVNIVMWWRRDQSDAWFTVSQASDIVVDLDSWELTALSWLGALSNFNLNLISRLEILCSDTKSTRCNLLDGRVGSITIFQTLQV